MYCIILYILYYIILYSLLRSQGVVVLDKLILAPTSFTHPPFPQRQQARTVSREFS